MCSHGGMIAYRPKSAMSRRTAPDNLRILLVDTGVPRCTKQLVERVRGKTAAIPKVTAGILDALDQV